MDIPWCLVAPNEAELHRVAADLQAQHRAPVRVFAGDLEQAQTAAAIFDELLRDEVRIDILVNNAGHGQRGHFWKFRSSGICPSCA